MRPTNLTRRRLLSGAGVAGVASLTGFALTTEGSKGFTDTTTIQSVEGVTLTADWRETYNGEVLEDTRMAPTDSGAVLSLGNVLPGDDGVLSVRLGVESENEEESVSVDPRLTFALRAIPENGLSEPERRAGDTSPDTGELQEFIDAAIWYDTGLGNVDVFGANNGVQDLGEGLVTDGADGTLSEVADAVQDVSLAPEDCLGEEESVTVSFGWSFDAGAADVNVTQGDAVVFDFIIDGAQCGVNQ